LKTQQESTCFIRARAGHAPSPSQQELIDAHWNNAVQAV
jgi:hypothetical protein